MGNSFSSGFNAGFGNMVNFDQLQVLKQKQQFDQQMQVQDKFWTNFDKGAGGIQKLIQADVDRLAAAKSKGLDGDAKDIEEKIKATKQQLNKYIEANQAIAGQITLPDGRPIIDPSQVVARGQNYFAIKDPLTDIAIKSEEAKQTTTAQETAKQPFEEPSIVDKNNRPIVTQDGKQVYQDTGEPVPPDMEQFKMTTRQQTGTPAEFNATWNREQAKHFYKQKDVVEEEATLANRNMFSFEETLRLLPQIDTGMFTETKLAAAKMLTAMGQEVPSGFMNIPGTEAFIAQVKSQVLTGMEAMKGAQSNQDLKVVQKANAQAGTTKEANEIIIRAGREVAFQKVLRAQLFRDAEESKNPTKTINDYRDRVESVNKVGANKDGSIVYFNEFYRHYEKMGYHFDRIMDSWIANYGR